MLPALTRALAAAAVAFCVFPAAAQGPRLDLPPPEPAEVSERLLFLEERLEAKQLHGEIWHYGWLAVDTGGLALNTFGLVDADDREQRVFSAVEATKSLLGVADSLLRPLPARLGADPVRALPGGTPERELARLRTAERLLAASAARARLKRTPWPHLANALVNLAGGGIILALGEWEDAALSTGLGLVLGEARILTVPSQPAEDLRAYRARYAAPAPASARGWDLVPRPGGVAIAYRF